MAIYLSRKKGGTVATPITPSNSSPAQMTANTPVNPTANGYAIESYNTKTPSNSSPVALASGEIDKIGGNGYAIESYANIDPEGNMKDYIWGNEFYRSLSDGYAIGSSFLNTITPSNSSPVTLSSGSIYEMSGAGKAVASVTSKTPSDSSPASVSSGAIIKASASGYLYSTVQKKVKTGSVSLTANTNNTITTGFQSKYICWNVGTGSLCAYNEDISTTQFRKASSSGISNVNVGTSASYNLISISSTGFVIRGASSAVTMNYFAIG